MENNENKSADTEDVSYQDVTDQNTETQPVVEIKQPTPKNPIKNANVPTIIKMDAAGRPDISNITPAEMAKYKALSQSISKTDNNTIMNYGAALQNKLAGFSDSFLNNVRAFDAGEIGGTITDLLANVNMIEVDPSSQSALKRMLMIIPGMKSVIMNTKKMFQKYDSVSKNIDGIVTKLDHGKLTLVKDNQQLNTLFNDNVQYIKELDDLIIAGYLAKDDLEKELVEMETNTQNFQDYQVSDQKDLINRLSKRLTDMQLTRMIVVQSLPQIRLVQNNNATMMEKIQASISTTIPLWRNTLSVAVTLQRQGKMAEVMRQVSDATNTMLEKNAEMLKTNSIEIAKQNEEGVVKIETLRKVQTDLISTLNDIRKIKEEGEIKRKGISKELKDLEMNLEREVLGLQQKNTDL